MCWEEVVILIVVEWVVHRFVEEDVGKIVETGECAPLILVVTVFVCS